VIEIDGAAGEGGGQVLRTALALSLLTRKPFRIVNIRAKRNKPGLLRQHMTAVEAATRVGDAAVEGVALGAAALTFVPKTLRGGAYSFAIGTAGSTMLVLQTVLLPLALAPEPSTIDLEGGTHNPAAPPFEFIDQAYLPLLRRMGAEISIELLRPGFYPAGGGRIRVSVTPAAQLGRLDLEQRGEIAAAAPARSWPTWPTPSPSARHAPWPRPWNGAPTPSRHTRSASPPVRGTPCRSSSPPST
jgi:RNA 3'-terminal phosphate cyclase (ATP)